jgi:hypothetical protein
VDGFSSRERVGVWPKWSKVWRDERIRGLAQARPDGLAQDQTVDGLVLLGVEGLVYGRTLWEKFLARTVWPEYLGRTCNYF